MVWHATSWSLGAKSPAADPQLYPPFASSGNRMRTGERRQVYGLLLGYLAFLAGCVVAYVFLWNGVLPEFSRWRVSIWVYLSAHYVQVATTAGGALGSAVVATWT
jgi:hypothetical protein